MKLYLASVGKSESIIKTLSSKYPEIGVLYSFADKKNSLVDLCIEVGVSLIIDSGAFSVKTRGIEISVEEYSEYLIQNNGNFDVRVALDVIGNERKSMENFDYMKSMGLDILPVWHVDDSFDCLAYYVANSDYVGLGGIAAYRMLNFEKAYRAFERVFVKHPDTKFHLFGSSNVRLIKSLPFYSSDSSTWRGGSRFGWVMTPYGNYFIGWGDDIDKVPVDVCDWLIERGIQVPFPEDGDPSIIDLMNIEYLYNELVLADCHMKRAMSQSLF